MCLLFETIRIDQGKAHFVPYHQRRVDRSVGAGCIDLQKCIGRLELPKEGCFKLRITYTEQGIVGSQIAPYTPRAIRTLRLVFDDHIAYDCKWDDRSAIDRLYGLRDGCHDVLIVRNGLITDASFANVALFDGQRWVTPCEPLLAGTCRARLIDQGFLTPMPISVQSLADYPKLTLINAMIGFDPCSVQVIVPQGG